MARQGRSYVLPIVRRIQVNDYARPDTDDDTGLWTVAPLFPKVDEVTPDDGDLISSEILTISGTTSVAKLSLGTVPDPATGINHVLRVRARAIFTLGSTATLNAELRQGGTLIATLVTPTLGTGFVTYENALTTAEADSITSYAALSIWLSGVFAAGNLGSVQVSWLELDVPPAVASLQVVIGLQANEEDLGLAGSVILVAGGAMATEDDLGQVGSGFIVVAGVLAAEDDLGNAGTIVLSPSGSQALEQDEGLVGSQSLVVIGNPANETNEGLGGLPILSPSGAQAQEQDEINAGSGGIFVPGFQALELDIGLFGLPSVFATGAQAQELDLGLAGLPFLGLAGTRADEENGALAGAVLLAGLGQLAQEQDGAFHGLVLLSPAVCITVLLSAQPLVAMALGDRPLVGVVTVNSVLVSAVLSVQHCEGMEGDCYNVGDVAVLTAVVTVALGLSPRLAVVVVQRPDGTEFNQGASELPPGTWQTQVALTVAGQWRYRFEFSNPAGAELGSLVVTRQLVGV